jgi:hypothetical protein
LMDSLLRLMMVQVELCPESNLGLQFDPNPKIGRRLASEGSLLVSIAIEGCLFKTMKITNTTVKVDFNWIFTMTTLDKTNQPIETRQNKSTNRNFRQHLR